MDDAQELRLLCWEGGLDPEGGWDGTWATSVARLLRELQRLVEPHLGEKAALSWRTAQPGGLAPLGSAPRSPVLPSSRAASGFSA